MRKTKIVCTLGPSTDKDGILEELIKEGMNVARFNFSHGSHEEQKKRLDQLKELRTKWNKPIAAMLDTKGPEIRIGDFKDGSIELEAGQSFTLTTAEIEGTQEKASITYKDLCKDVKPGDSILIDDGLIGMEVLEINGTDIVCQVKNGGKVSNKKGVNVPGVELKMPFISEKDRSDIIFGIEQGFDFIAASFTRTADDVREIQQLLAEHNCDNINIIAKIENQQGVDNIDEIIAAADGIMVARGDMGVEIPLEEVPVIQKNIIRKVFEAGKQVITATQMLDSMIKHPRPTRAETTDVANAIYQGTSAIMLSGETAAGLYPVEALKTMDKIAVRIESDLDYEDHLTKYSDGRKKDMTTAISHATCMTAMELNAKAILTVSKSGKTARMVSRYRPKCMIIGCTTTDYNCRQLNMSWGIYPIQLREEYSMDVLFVHAVEAAKKMGYVEDDDIIVLTAGVPLGRSGNTNLIRTSVVKEF